jgi:hypothetical protein
MKKYLLLTGLILLTGCGLKSVVIPNLDFIVSKEVGDKLYLYNDQEKELDKDIIKLLNGSKPVVKKLVKTAKAIDFDHKKTFSQVVEFNKVYYEMMDSFIPIVMKHVVTMDDKQLKKFFKDREKERKDLKKTIKKNKMDYLNKKFKFFFIELNKKQKEITKKHKKDYYRMLGVRLNKMSIVLKQMRKVIESKESADKKQELLVNMHLDFYHNRGDDKYRESVFRMIAGIVEHMSDKQKKHFTKQKNKILPYLEAYLKEEY